MESLVSDALPTSGSEAAEGNGKDTDTRRDRIRVRQERNRLAAKKCREKKQREYAELEKTSEVLREENLVLRTQLTSLLKELNDLKNKM